jgi:phage-related protein
MEDIMCDIHLTFNASSYAQQWYAASVSKDIILSHLFQIQSQKGPKCDSTSIKIYVKEDYKWNEVSPVEV